MALKHVDTLTASTAVIAGDRGGRFAIQPDIACYVAVGTSSIVASATNGVKVAAEGFYEDTISSADNIYVSVVSVSGGAFNAKRFRDA